MSRAMPEGRYYPRISVDGVDLPLNKHCGDPYSIHCSFYVSQNVISRL